MEQFGITPYPLAILLCERVIVDAETQQKTLIGIFDRVLCPSLPAVKPMALYAKLTDAEGEYRFTIDLVHLPTDRKLASTELVGTVTNRLDSTEIVMQVTAAMDQHGLYEFRLYANGAYVAQVTFNAVTPSAEGT